jgi:hypothetical protein
LPPRAWVEWTGSSSAHPDPGGTRTHEPDETDHGRAVAVIVLEIILTESYFEQSLERIRAEYLEMPGLCLTLEQMLRLSGVERTVCQMVLDSLVDAKFLNLKPNGGYARLTDEAIHRSRAAKAHVNPNSSQSLPSFQNRQRTKLTRSA